MFRDGGWKECPSESPITGFDFIWEEMQDLLVKMIKEVYNEIVVVSPEELDIYARFYASGVIFWSRKDYLFMHVRRKV